MVQTVSRRERQREATYDEIVRVSRALLAEGLELSLRAVAGRMGMTAPALYRYVASYQELVDLVAFEIDKAATEEFRAAAETQPADDALARLICASVAFRRWALRDRAEFSLVFANPVADTACVRRDELLTSATSGVYLNGLLVAVWHQLRYDHPELDELDPVVVEVLRDPVLPIDLTEVPDEHRGLLWVFMQGWATLYGTVTLEVFGHLDPRIIESGALFAEMLAGWLPRLGSDDADGRYRSLLLAEIARE
ncbi:TetR/AcrR family transcriptional regulator [Nocardioides coralli]|uniref:TetR/AcrR family transcriptional regulator n=1 Tax=Nocardioides coralli TaxID=2872154 RepID=UPI001CA3D997|nr:TetR-like C-terminal domain-containing protein [Nocardioides coralli]QZY29308.1 WHG domain-containing protein [Nocardioides coralli]